MKDQKFYRINPAHERLRSHWVATTPENKIQVSADLNIWENAHFGDGFGANICDFNRRGTYSVLIREFLLYLVR